MISIHAVNINKPETGHLAHSLLFVAVLFACLMAFPITAYSFSKSEKFSSSEKLLTQRSCYTGPLSSYNSWQQAIVAKGKLTKEKFARYYPEDLYNQYKANFACYVFVYQSDAFRVKGFVVLPTTKSVSKHPVVIFNRGGNDVRQHTLNYSKLFKFHFPLAEAGYIVISSQYRGAKVWKHFDPEIHGRDEFGGADVGDIHNLIPIIEGIASADNSNIGMLGWSRGAMMSLLAAKQMPNVKALVLGGTPVDLLSMTKERPKMEQHVFSRLIPDYATHKTAQLKARSAIYWPDDIKRNTPILMFHGTTDWRVSIAPAREFAQMMQTREAPIEFIEFPNGSHGLWENMDSVRQNTIQWFNSNLLTALNP